MEQAEINAEDSLPQMARVPLCVDLDGTLVKSDTLVDSVLAMARQRPEELWRIPGWIARGKAAFKREVTGRVSLDVEHLPYNRELLGWLRQEHGAGREIYLVTAADGTLARRVAEHLGIFAGVMASDGAHNLAGVDKLAALRARFGCDFSYVGNALPDAPALQVCHEPMTANSHGRLRAALRQAKVEPARTFHDRTHRGRAWLKAIRLHQWAKNVLLFLPLLLAHAWSRAELLGALVGFIAFGLCASATYIINDLLDIEADRRHPRKGNRPFAAGDLSPMAGVGVVALFFAVAVGLTLLLPRMGLGAGGVTAASARAFLGWLGIYTVTTLAYSLVLKRKVLLDVFVLSGLYTVRLLAGAALTHVPMSAWLVSFSVFLFLSLAFVKRFSELEALQARDAAVRNGRGYLLSDIEQLRAFGTGVGCAAAVVLSLYIHDADAVRLYRHAERLWLVVPLLLLWLFRVWILASRGQMDEDPVVYAITDRRSLLIGAAVAAVVLSAL